VYGLVLPRLGETACRARGYDALIRLGPGTRAGGMRAEDVPAYRHAWSQPGAVHGMIAWYRAMIPALFRRFPRTRIAAPTLLLWGKRDPFLASAMARPSMELCERGRLVVLEEQTHWLHWDAPDQVNALIADWLGAAPEEPPRGG
jgi:pimeloyl-ACP methyl ester carboxylesterase